MPWDADLDVQISEKSMNHLADYYNMTVHHYKLPGVEGGRDFLLEINPRWEIGSPSDKTNRIDGRWIDMTSGLYVDMTTLRNNVTAQAEGKEGAMMCKDLHNYMYEDIFPLRETTFEGAAARIPFAYADVLTEEYGSESLSRTDFNGYNFDPAVQEWIQVPSQDTN
jgi:phosphorylcholine metabolism protein LicD